MKKYLYLLSTVSAALIIGCGNGSSVSDQEYSYDTSSIFGYSKEITYKDYLVKAVDDPIIHATVKATNCETFEERGNGEYLLKKCIAKPLYIEIKDGIIKDKNVTQDFPLLLNVGETDKDDNFVVTPLTTILANADESNISALAKKLGVSKEDLFDANNEKVKKFLPKLNAILITANSQGAVTNKVKFLEVVREKVINNVKDGDINISKTLDDIKKESIEKPSLFGLVIIDNSDIDNDDPLDSISKIQHLDIVKFYGLVFDKKIADADVSVKDLDTNATFSAVVKSKNHGDWVLEVEKNETKGSLYYTIMNEDHLLQFVATKKEGSKTIELTSTITTKKLREYIKKSKIVSPSKDLRLIISNVTTSEDAILDKKGALNKDSYEGNLTELRIYYQDKVVKLASVIKSVVDENATINASATDTYDLAKRSIVVKKLKTRALSDSSSDFDINTSVVNYDTADLEGNITNNTILSAQLNKISTEKEDKFQMAAEKAGYTFYRLLAYYDGPSSDESNFVRGYTKIIVYPSYYETKTCYLYGDSTGEWVCDKEKKIEDNSNFTLGYYEVNDKNKTITYSLDLNNSVYVPDLNKSYNYYGVVKSKTDLISGITKTEPMILVDSYDVVDAFRRLPNEDSSTFDELQDVVKPYKNKEEVNYALNRWVKSFINDVKDYFKEK